MKVSKAVNLFLDYHKMNSQKIIIRAFGLIPQLWGLLPSLGWQLSVGRD
jgi:hypothetical protein